MLNFRHLLARCIHSSKCTRVSLSRRTFLSESYSCREAWENRLESTVLKKVNTRTLFQELDAQFSHFGKASALDVDIYVNACTKTALLDDVETILTLLRLCPDSSFTLPSTHHAVLRLLLDADRTEKLLSVVSDRLKYGIFPDHYCSKLLMDTFLKRKQYAAAARVGVSQMLQEDWEDILTTRLSLYSCHMYLRNQDQQWYSHEEIKTPPPEPKEVVKVRVQDVRNPYFDDHFDIKDPKQLVGKTFSMFSTKVGGSEIVTCSYLLTGLTLHQKWNQVIELARKLASSKKPVFREAIQLARDSLPTMSGTDQKQLTPNSEIKQEGTPDKEMKKEDHVAEKDGIMNEVDKALHALESFALDEDMVLEMEKLVKEAVSEQEAKDIEQQKQVYIQWDEDRISALKKQQEEIRREETLKQIEQQKTQLIEEERELFFFDNEEKIDLLIEERDAKLASLDWLKTQQKSAKALKEEADAAYVPPEVVKKHST